MYDTYTENTNQSGQYATVLPIRLMGMLTDNSLQVLWIDHNGPSWSSQPINFLFDCIKTNQILCHVCPLFHDQMQ